MSPEHATTPETMQNELQKQLEAERALAVRQHASHVAAIRAQRGFAGVSAQLDHSSRADYPHQDFILGNLSHTHTRRQNTILNQAAHQADVPVHLYYRDNLPADYRDGEPGLVWIAPRPGNVTQLGFRLIDPSGEVNAATKRIEAEQNKPFEMVADALKQGADHAMTERSYSLASTESQDIIFDFMRINPAGETPIVRGVQFVHRTEEMPQHTAEAGYPPATESGEGVYRNADGTLQKILTETAQGIYQAMYFEPGATHASEACRLGVEIDNARVQLGASLEYDFSNEVPTTPFIYTQTSQEIVKALDDAMLTPRSRVRRMFAGTNTSNTYGSNFAELSREVARSIGDASRPFDRIFEGDETLIRQALTQLSTEAITTEGARVFIDLLQQAAGRPDFASDIPTSDDTVTIHQSSCKDTESHCKQAIAEGGFYFVEIPESTVVMAQQQHGDYGDTLSINLTPVMYKGVELPPGSLFRVKEGQYLFLRLTTFAFSRADAKDAFTWQYNYDNYGDGSRRALAGLQTAYENQRTIQQRLAPPDTTQGY